MDEYTKLLYLLAGISVVTFVGWTINSIINIKIKLQELSTKSSSIEEMKSDIKVLTSLVWEIAGKLGVPIRRE